MNKKIKNKTTKVLLTVLSLCIFFGILFSATPNKVNYQGVLKEKGQLITGIKKMKFSIYDSAVGGNLKWTSGVVDVEVKNGVFRYVLNLPSDFDWSKGPYYLEVKVGDTVLSPREEIASSIYAIHAEVASSVVGSISAEQDLDMKGHNILNLSTITAQSEGIYLATNIFVTQGNVGIGTTAPSQKLHVAGKLQVGNDAATPTAGAIRWTGTNFEGFDGSVWRTLDVQATSGGGWTEDMGGNKVYLTNSGRNVGIGTTAPDRKLDVNGGAVVRSSMVVTGAGLSGTQPVFQVAGSTMVVQYNGNVGIGTAAPTAKLTIGPQNANHLELQSANSAWGWKIETNDFLGGNVPLQIFQKNAGTYTEVMRITQGGNVGIGTTAPAQKLTVTGNIGLQAGANAFVGTLDNYALSLRTNNADRVFITNTGNVGIGTTAPTSRLHVRSTDTIAGAMRVDNPGGTAIVYVSTSGNVGIGTTSPGNILTVVQNSATDPIADAWTTYSSRRWKTNIQPIQGAIEKVKKLRGVYFDWKADGKHDIGMIAEEVGEVIPEVVVYEDNGKDAKSLDYARLVSVLVEAIKEQQKEIEKLRLEIEELRKQR